MIAKIKFDHFTAFENLELQFSSGINVFVGANGTGKTHVLKAIYSACEITKSGKSYAEKINNVFHPFDKQIGRLVKRTRGGSRGFIELVRTLSDNKNITLRLSMTSKTKKPESAKISGSYNEWKRHPISSVYIPVKDMLAHAPGFIALHEEREIHFAEIYPDIIRKASMPILRGATDARRRPFLKRLQKAIAGKVIQENEAFFLRSKQGKLEFSLLAEGFRKLGLLWLLIQNGSLPVDKYPSVLLWDEPEANMNPFLLKEIIGILLDLQRQGVQIFITTHNYVVLKEIDLQLKKDDQIKFFSFFRNQNDEVEVDNTDKFVRISNNPIDKAFSDLTDREIERSLRDLKL